MYEVSTTSKVLIFKGRFSQGRETVTNANTQSVTCTIAYAIKLCLSYVFLLDGNAQALNTVQHTLRIQSIFLHRLLQN